MPERGRLHILVEGQTEETIARETIAPYLTSVGWWVTYSIVTTKRPAGGPAHKGGGDQLGPGAARNPPAAQRFRPASSDDDARLLRLPPRSAWNEYPASREAGRSGGHVEGALRQHFDDQRFLPHLTLHETEAWVFAARNQLAELYGNPTIAAKLQADIDLAGGVEMVNDNPATAPSKRLVRHCPGYLKTTDGPLAISDLGLEALRLQCPHLDAWLDRLSQ
ncbi:MAG TPA: DUF4276 family protein [Actinophytocola sp.]|uniref:DUF4276 family protein n=1 Tax=Actinophytocola sp. TaxID=1872138 RepID=UPI002E06B342|nr:DUF4276 family protein [Actinophytocola sp.]